MLFLQLLVNLYNILEMIKFIYIYIYYNEWISGCQRLGGRVRVKGGKSLEKGNMRDAYGNLFSSHYEAVDT